MNPTFGTTQDDDDDDDDERLLFLNATFSVCSNMRFVHLSETTLFELFRTFSYSKKEILTRVVTHRVCVFRLNTL